MSQDDKVNREWLRKLRTAVEDMRNPCFGSELHNQTVRDIENMLLVHVDEILASLSAERARVDLTDERNIFQRDAAASSASPSNSVLVPRELTAENGAKAALSGEFTFEPYLGHDGKTLVPWDMIKQIHRKVVELYGTPSATQEQLAQSLAHHDAIIERCAQIIEARAWLGQGNAAGAIRALKSAKAEGSAKQ